MQYSKESLNSFINKKILYFFPSDRKEMEWQYFHFVKELNEYDIEFDLFNPLKYGADFEEELIKKIKRDKDRISIFLTGSFDGEISISTLTEIRKEGIPTVLICYDNLSIPFVHKKTSKYYDLVWLTSYETEYLFKKWGATTIFLPYAANPYLFKPSQEEVRNCVGFIGSIYGNRPLIINSLTKNNIHVQLYTKLDSLKNISENPLKKHFKKIKHSFNYFSNLVQFRIGRKCIKGTLRKGFSDIKQVRLIENNFLQINDRVSFPQMIQLYSEIAVSLNSIELLDTYVLKKPILKIHLRVFEVPMCGGVQIAKRNNEIQSYFQEDKEILLYDTMDELVDKTKFYLNNSHLIKKIKISARNISVKSHTWKNRFSKLHERLFE